MALHVFNDTQTSEYSENGTFTNPLNIVKNGTISNTQTILMYLNNNDSGAPPAFQFDNVTIQPIPDSKIGINSLAGWWMKIIDGVAGLPSEDDWDAISPANTLSYSDPTNGGIATRFPANITYFYPFYVRIYIPAGTEVQQTRVVKLDINGTQI